jgi:PAS domain S-box-containing protein
VSERMTGLAERPLTVDPHASDREQRRPGGHDDLFRSLFEWSGLCIACVDPTQRVVEANAEFFRVFNRSSTEVHGRDVVDLLHPGFGVSLRRELARLVDGRRARFTENVIVLRHGGGAVSGDLTGIAVGAGGRPSLLLVLFAPYQAVDGPPSMPGTDALLTDVGARILEGVAAGVSTVRLAAQLYLSRQGVEYHVGAMLRRLNVPNRAALVSKAYELGILSVGTWPPRVVPHMVK